MSHEIKFTEGIVLRSVSFRENSQIVTLFTQDVGLIKVFYSSRKNKRVSPLTLVELVYKERQGDLFRCQEMTLLDFFSHIRTEFTYIQAASELLEIIHNSQEIGKRAPKLYALLCFYLRKIPSTPNLAALISSFKLKQFLHDGLLSLPFICSVCQTPLSEIAYGDSQDMRCTNHKLPYQTQWTKEELDTLFCLTFSDSFKILTSIPCDESLKTKIFLL